MTSENAGMTAGYEIDARRRLIILRGPPPQEFGSWKATVEMALADPRTADDCNLLSDRRGPWPSSPTAVARQVADYLSDREIQFAGRRWAVVTNEPGEFGMARMVGSLASASGVSIQAFYDYEKALAWLQAPKTE